MRELVVDADARDTRKSTRELWCRPGAVAVQVFFPDGIELRGGHTGGNMRAHRIARGGDRGPPEMKSATSHHDRRFRCAQ